MAGGSRQQSGDSWAAAAAGRSPCQGVTASSCPDVTCVRITCLQSPSACRCAQLSPTLGLPASQSGSLSQLRSQPPHSRCCSAWHPVAHQVPPMQTPQQQQQNPQPLAPHTLPPHSGRRRSGALARQAAPRPAQAARPHSALHRGICMRLRCAARAELRQQARIYTATAAFVLRLSMSAEGRPISVVPCRHCSAHLLASSCTPQLTPFSLVMQASPRQPHAATLDAHSTAAMQRLHAGSDVVRRVASQRPAYKLAAPVAAMSGRGQAPGAEQTSPGLIIRGLKRPRSAAEPQGARSPAAAAAAAWQPPAEASQTEGVQPPGTPSLAATPRRGVGLRPQSASPRARVPVKRAGGPPCRLLGPGFCCISACAFVSLTAL